MSNGVVSCVKHSSAYRGLIIQCILPLQLRPMHPTTRLLFHLIDCPEAVVGGVTSQARHKYSFPLCLVAENRTSCKDYMYNLDKLVLYADNKAAKAQFDSPENVCGNISRVNDAHCSCHAYTCPVSDQSERGTFTLRYGAWPTGTAYCLSK